MAARLERSTVLYQPGRSILFLVTEAALRLRIVTRAAHVEQLDRLAVLATLESVTLAVIAVDAPVSVPPVSGFALFELAEESVVCVELLAGEVTVTDPVEVARYHGAAARWRASAMIGDQALAVLRRIRDDLDQLADDVC